MGCWRSICSVILILAFRFAGRHSRHPTLPTRLLSSTIQFSPLNHQSNLVIFRNVPLLPHTWNPFPASNDFLEPVQSRLPMCLSCGEFAFFVASCWLGCLSFAVAPVRLSPDYTVLRCKPELQNLCNLAVRSGIDVDDRTGRIKKSMHPHRFLIPV